MSPSRSSSRTPLTCAPRTRTAMYHMRVAYMRRAKLAPCRNCRTSWRTSRPWSRGWSANASSRCAWAARSCCARSRRRSRRRTDATVVGLARIGKRIVLALEGERFLVLHLMVAGRLHWKKKPGKVGGRGAVAAFDFADGSLVLSEASTKKRASLHFVAGRAALADFDRGGIEVAGRAARSVSRGADPREPHAEARADRSAALLGHRQRLLRRDPASREALARQAHAAAVGRGDRSSPFRDPGGSDGVDGAARRRGGGGLPGEGDRVPGGDGRPRQVRKAVPRLRHEGPADRVRRERGELLPDLPDRRKAACGPRAVAAACAATGRRRWRSWRSGSGTRRARGPSTPRFGGEGRG